jgi:hypothetical protein
MKSKSAAVGQRFPTYIVATAAPVNLRPTTAIALAAKAFRQQQLGKTA